MTDVLLVHDGCIFSKQGKMKFMLVGAKHFSPEMQQIVIQRVALMELNSESIFPFTSAYALAYQHLPPNGGLIGNINQYSRFNDYAIERFNDSKYYLLEFSINQINYLY